MQTRRGTSGPHPRRVSTKRMQDSLKDVIGVALALAKGMTRRGALAAQPQILSRPPGSTARTRRAQQCRRKFLSYFPDGFRDEGYLESEREYKWEAHLRWRDLLGERDMRRLIAAGEHREIAKRAIGIEARTNLLFSFEKMAIRDAVKEESGAQVFAEALMRFLHGGATAEARFRDWVEAIETLPRRKTRVLTWPVATVFGFIARPSEHIFVKPNVTRSAAAAYGYTFVYHPRPAWTTYCDVLGFAAQVRSDTRDLRPRDKIDLQSFIWVQGSDEYPD
jgi:hypothetical protein